MLAWVVCVFGSTLTSIPASSQTLTSINLTHNLVGEDGARALLSALPHYRGITAFSLDANPDVPAAVLADLLRYLDSLRTRPRVSEDELAAEHAMRAALAEKGLVVRIC